MEDEVWIPLVDEPLGEIVARIEDEHPDIAALVASPQRLLAFRTFAYIKVGLLLGELLVEDDGPESKKGGTWVEALISDPAVWERVVRDVRSIAEDIAREAAPEAAGPDASARERFREFAKRALPDD